MSSPRAARPLPRTRVVAVPLVAAALLLGGCAHEDDGAPPPSPATESVPVPEYGDDLTPTVAAMTLVPAEATELRVTALDQVRLQLGVPDLTGQSTPAERAAFWRRAGRTAPLLTSLRLRADDASLLEQYGFTQDDVEWEAEWSGPDGEGWLLRFRDDLDMGAVEEAAAARRGPLAGATVAASRQLVGSGFATDPAQSWAADPAKPALAGSAASAVYVRDACLPLADGVADEAGAALGDLDELGPFSLLLGGELATAYLGVERADAFARARLADELPPTRPPFSNVLSEPVADPGGGRIGWTLGDARAAARLVDAGALPFAVCAEE